MVVVVVVVLIGVVDVVVVVASSRVMNVSFGGMSDQIPLITRGMVPDANGNNAKP